MNHSQSQAVCTSLGRRTVLKGAAWSAPAIVLLGATPAIASSGSAEVRLTAERLCWYPEEEYPSPRYLASLEATNTLPYAVDVVFTAVSVLPAPPKGDPYLEMTLPGDQGACSTPSAMLGPTGNPVPALWRLPAMSGTVTQGCFAGPLGYADLVTVSLTYDVYRSDTCALVVSSAKTQISDSIGLCSPPRPLGLDPDHGPTGGGTPVMISGYDLDGWHTVTVTFGDVVAPDVAVTPGYKSDWIDCTSPAHGPGAVSVVVTMGTSDGNTWDYPAGEFTYDS